MRKPTLLSLLAATTGTFSQFPFRITKPLHQEFVNLGADNEVTLQANVSAATYSLDMQLTLCRIISGPSPPCNGTSGRVIFTAPYTPPEQTFSVLFPSDSIGGLTRLIAGHIDGSVLVDETEIEIYLGTH